ncbi:xanthine dehydrogenase accessory factor [Azospirillaceae bacterium]
MIPPYDVSEAAALTHALDWRRRGKRIALATTLTTSGTAPRPVGSVLAIAETGEVAGSVSAGCIENAVIEAAHRAMKENSPIFLSFESPNEEARLAAPWSVGLSCGGHVEVYVRPLSDDDAQYLQRLLVLRAQRHSVALVTVLQTGTQALYRLDKAGRIVAEDSTFDDFALENQIAACLRSSQNAVVIPPESPERRILVQSFVPPLRLLIVGAVHIAQALASMAQTAEYEVTVIDPRKTLITPERFPNIALEISWPDDALLRLVPDSKTAVAVLAHDPKLDDPALLVALRSSAFYVGALGSRKTQATRRRRLQEAGVPDVELEKLHGPIGMAIGARSPAEIAVSILADLVFSRNKPT